MVGPLICISIGARAGGRIDALHQLPLDPDPMLRHPIPVSQFLANVPLFSGLGDESLERIAAEAVPVYAARGADVFHGGEQCSGMYAVLFGHLKLALRAAQGGERVIDLVGPGQTMGEAAVFLDQPYYATATALADSKLVHIPKATMQAEVDRNSGFARRLIVNLSRRVYQRVSDMESYTMCSATDRVVHYLLNDLPQPGQDDAESVTLPAPKGVIASRLNLTQEHFSRVLRDLISAGLIKVDGRAIRISDVNGLRARAA